MSLAYLEDQIKIDSGMLVEPVREFTVARQILTPNQILDPSDQEITVETLSRNIVIATGMDPLQARRASSTLIKNTFEVPVFDAEVQHGYDEYVRIARSKYPTAALMADVGISITENEDTMFFTASNGADRPGDGEGMCADSNFVTPTAQLDLGTYPEAIQTLGGMMNDLLNGKSGEKGMKSEAFKYPSYLIVNADVWARANGLLNTTNNETVLMTWNRMLGEMSAGSRVIVSDFLANTIVVGADGVIVVTQTSSNAALLLASPKVLGIYSSAFDIRQEPLSKVKGFYAKVVERWLPLIHNKEGIIFEDGVQMTA